MVRGSFALSLLASAGSFFLSEATQLRGDNFLAGSDIVEFEDASDPVDFFSHMESVAEIRRKYDSPLFKGAAIQFMNVGPGEEEVAALTKLLSVKRVWPNRLYELPKDEVIWTGQSNDVLQSGDTNTKRQSEGDTFAPHLMTQVDRLRAKGFVGKGVKIAILDSGIDYTHPALGGCFGPGCLVTNGYDFVGDDYTGSNVPVPDDDPADCNGHGTHVAGTIAAQANEHGFTGAAPGATISAYRVLGCNNRGTSDVFIDAYIRAYRDGANIITGSLVGQSGWSEEPWAVVVSRIVAAGVPCPISVGNEGEMGLFFGSSGSSGKRVTAVASVDNSMNTIILTESSFRVDGGAAKTFTYAIGNVSAWGVTLSPWTPNFDTADPAQACKPLPKNTPDLSRRIVLIRRGSCQYFTQLTNAAAYGAKYALFYNNGPTPLENPFIPSVAGIRAVGLVTASQGEAWVRALAAGSDVVLNMTDPSKAPIFFNTSQNTITGGAASYFTTWNPTFELDVKPQVAAPGGNILSTYPRALGSYALMSGTSMACPLVAAIYALIAEVRGTFDPATLEALVASTANPRLFNEGIGNRDALAPVPQVGAGLIQAYDAAYVTTLLSKSYLAFNDTDHLQTVTFRIRNLGRESVGYNLGSVGAATAYTFSNSIYPDRFPGLAWSKEYARVNISPSRVTLPPSGSADISVTITPPRLNSTRLPVYSGYITINSTNGENLSLPYNGVAGSLYNTRILGEVFLTKSDDSSLNPISGNPTFVLPGQSLPTLVARMAFGSPSISIGVQRIFRTSAGVRFEDYGDIRGSPIQYYPRIPLFGVFDGRLANGVYVPAGQYRLYIGALRVFGNSRNVNDYQVAATEPFTIRYG